MQRRSWRFWFGLAVCWVSLVSMGGGGHLMLTGVATAGDGFGGTPPPDCPPLADPNPPAHLVEYIADQEQIWDTLWGEDYCHQYHRIGIAPQGGAGVGLWDMVALDIQGADPSDPDFETTDLEQMQIATGEMLVLIYAPVVENHVVPGYDPETNTFYEVDTYVYSIAAELTSAQGAGQPDGVVAIDGVIVEGLYTDMALPLETTPYYVLIVNGIHSTIDGAYDAAESRILTDEERIIPCPAGWSTECCACGPKLSMCQNDCVRELSSTLRSSCLGMAGGGLAGWAGACAVVCAFLGPFCATCLASVGVFMAGAYLICAKHALFEFDRCLANCDTAYDLCWSQNECPGGPPQP